jgi:hypothetical protein
MSWAQDLTEARPIKEIVEARDKIYDLGKRIDIMTRPPIQDDEPSTPEGETILPEPQEMNIEDEDPEEEAEPEFVVNETEVSGRCSFSILESYPF